MTEPRQGFQRDINAIVDAFKAGLAFDPPLVSPTEYRDGLRFVGFPLRDDDDVLDPPHFDIPDPDVGEAPDASPEGDD